ncbi:hypothetical protein FXO37_04383 [Capsicum annuum]|nr:hypothetical protein FXO37_04383 [Capsicum annuum]
MTNINMWPRSTRPPIEPPEITSMEGRPDKNRKKDKDEAVNKKFGKATGKERKMIYSAYKCIRHNKKGYPILKKDFSSSYGSQPTSNRRTAGRPVNTHSAPTATERPANAASVGDMRPAAAMMPTTTSVMGATTTQSTTQQSTSGVGAQKRKTSTTLRGGANLAYKRPRQKKAK